MLILHLQGYRPDSVLSPNFSLGFNDSTLDLLNNAYTIQARIRTDLQAQIKATKAEVWSGPGSPISWGKLSRMVQDTWPWHRAHAQHSHQKLAHCSSAVTPTQGPYLQGALVQHLRQSTEHSIKQLVCCCKAQPRPGSCTWSPKAYKTDLNPEFASLAFCPYTCVPVIVALPTAGCKDRSDGLCISLASKAQRKLNFLHWACKMQTTCLQHKTLALTWTKWLQMPTHAHFPACLQASWRLYLPQRAPSKDSHRITTWGSKRQTIKLKKEIAAIRPRNTVLKKTLTASADTLHWINLLQPKTLPLFYF